MPETKKYETVIGLEVHAQLLTKSKMFCSCPADYIQGSPNSVVCPVCLAMPGVLPVINRRAVEYVIMTGLALNSTISQDTQFHRKNYPYPDLVKGYQISQYDVPIAVGGWLTIDVDGEQKKVGITRVHLEEDVAKLQHIHDAQGESYSLVDVNRAGIPLMETVSEPDMRSPEEARQYLENLRAILQYLGVSTGNMEDGSFRCDANISIRPVNSTELFTRTEIKNMNSFRAVYRALEYEVERQIKVVEEGGRVVQETRGWVEERGVTVSQRTKESAHDYRYFSEPDLPPLSISREWVKEVKAGLPELPGARRDRFVAEYGLSLYDASLLITSKSTADFFENGLRAKDTKPVEVTTKAKAIANWMLGDMTGLLNASGVELGNARITPQGLREFTDLIEAGTINGPAAKAVFEEMFKSGKGAMIIAEEQGLTQISDAGLLDEAVAEVLQRNPQAVQDFLGGKETAVKFLVGQVMKETRGRANPAMISKILLENLGTELNG
ncbi:MAG: Asp-tRNA(Asn)/Glu-tRNA(Gln) amidotransferase subunit GatB [Chloroflexi bacterium]|nr:Asp-tRNA(Asn)/Glu-tRNA(Gln) amidotransferase subunit GatB [Chloroflexota bacterium]